MLGIGGHQSLGVFTRTMLLVKQNERYTALLLTFILNVVECKKSTNVDPFHILSLFFILLLVVFIYFLKVTSLIISSLCINFLHLL